MDATINRIRKALQKTDRAEQIAKIAGISRQAAYPHLHKMAQVGEVKHEGRRWRLDPLWPLGDMAEPFIEALAGLEQGDLEVVELKVKPDRRIVLRPNAKCMEPMVPLSGTWKTLPFETTSDRPIVSSGVVTVGGEVSQFDLRSGRIPSNAVTSELTPTFHVGEVVQIAGQVVYLSGKEAHNLLADSTVLHAWNS